jgi:hypothetical protein
MSRKVLFIPIRGTKYHVAASVTAGGEEAITYPTFPKGLGLTQVRLIADALLQAATWAGKNGGKGKSKGKNTGYYENVGDDPQTERRKFVFPTDDSFILLARRAALGFGISTNPWISLVEQDEDMNPIPERYITVNSAAASQVALSLQVIAKDCQPWKRGEWA